MPMPHLNHNVCKYIYIYIIYIYVCVCVLFHVHYQFLPPTCSFFGWDGEHVDHDPWLSMKSWKVKIHLDQWHHGIFKNSLSLTLSGTRLHPNCTLFSVFCFGGVRLTYCSFTRTFFLRTLMTSFVWLKNWLQRGCFTKKRSVYECNFGWSFCWGCFLVARWIRSS